MKNLGNTAEEEEEEEEEDNWLYIYMNFIFTVLR